MRKDTEKSAGASTLNLAVRLMLFALVATLLLALVNGVTEGKIAENTRKKIDAARQKVIGDYEFEDAGFDLSDADCIAGVYRALDGENIAGYVYELESRGYGGTIYLCVGIGNDGTVTGIQISGHSETKGLGSAAEKPFLKRFSGMQAGRDSALDVDAMTGATISSTAIRKAVDEALKHFESAQGQEVAE